MDDNAKVLLVSQESDRVETTVKAVKLSITIKEMLETITTNSGDIEIPCDQIKKQTLQKIVDWLENNTDTAQPSSEDIKEKLAETISQWDQDYLEMPLAELYDLVSFLEYSGRRSVLWIF